MTTFTSFSFPATGTPTSRTLPARLSDIADVKDFGATGDGVTDDYDAIRAAYDHGIVTLVATQDSVGSTITFASVPSTVTTLMFAKDATNPSALQPPSVSRVASKTATTVTLGFISGEGAVQAGDTITFNLSQKGTIFFPSGTYLISEPLIIDGAGFRLLGVGPASTITANFSGYMLTREDSNNVDSSQLSSVENLTLINTHATGGGIRFGKSTLGAVRNLDITANKGVAFCSDDTPAPASGPLDMSMENISVSPGANVSGSIGIMSLSNGPITNCRIIGYASGMRVYGNQGGFNILGCYFEGNIIGLELGVSPNGTSALSGGMIMSGCWFKNNGTAIKFGGASGVLGAGGGRFCGIRIEADEDVLINGSRPQYGIHIPSGKYGNSLFAGIIVTGQYDQYGIYIGEDTSNNNNWMGIQVENTSTHGGLTWRMPTTTTAKYVGCNVVPVLTVAGLPSSKFEGNSYNVSDSNVSTWGDTATGSGSTHAKVRWNGANWTVVGK